MQIEQGKNMDEKVKNNIAKIIEDSFEQSDGKKCQEKICHSVNNQIKKLYPKEKWSIIFILQEQNDAYSIKTHGKIFFCKYRNYKIIIYPSKIEKAETKNNLKEEDNEDIKSLNKTISDIKIQLKESNTKIQNYELTINELKSKFDESKNNLEASQKLLIEKEKEINELKNQLNSIDQKSSFNESFYKRNQMIALNFMSTDNSLNYAISCIKKDIFIDAERKLYDKFPEYRETNNNFVVDGKTILRFKSIEENHLENGIPIMIIKS